MDLPRHPWIRTDKAPLFVWTFPPETTDRVLFECVSERERWAQQWSAPCAWVVDLRLVRSVPPTQRQVFGTHLKCFEPHDIRYNRGSALVVPNSVLSGIVTAIFWLAPPKFPHRSFTVLADAEVWARSQLELNAGAPDCAEQSSRGSRARWSVLPPNG
jgi:hypothetical protein